MTLLIRNLLKENKDLRSMLKNMTSFVGEGQSFMRHWCAQTEIKDSDHACLASD